MISSTNKNNVIMNEPDPMDMSIPPQIPVHQAVEQMLRQQPQTAKQRVTSTAADQRRRQQQQQQQPIFTHSVCVVFNSCRLKYEENEALISLISFLQVSRRCFFESIGNGRIGPNDFSLNWFSTSSPDSRFFLCNLYMYYIISFDFL
jgi:hypothetical protein